MSGAPTSGSIRSAPPERGIAYRARAPGRRSPRSSRRWGKPITRRRGTGDLIARTSRYARCETPKRFWELSMNERVTKSFIRDDFRDTSLRHRSLESCLRSKDSRAVRGGADGKVPNRATRRRPTLPPVRFGEGRLEKGCGRSTSLAAYSTSTLGPPSGFAKLRCLTQRDLGLALDWHSPKVPCSVVADRHLCQGICLGGSATSVSWRQPPCFGAGHQRSIRTLPTWTTSPAGPSCGVHAPESRASATRIAP